MLLVLSILVFLLLVDSFSNFLKHGKTMAVSFLSTVPNLLPIVPVHASITSASRYPTLAATVRCSKIEADADNKDRLKRRSILKCFGATVGLELVRSSGTFVEMAEAADLIQRRQRCDFQSRIKDTLYKAIKENPDVIPSLLTLALNDIMTYDKARLQKLGAQMDLSDSEISRSENKGLVAALNLVEEAKKEIDSYSKGGPISYSDLNHYAAQSAIKNTFLAAAIRKYGGNVGREVYYTLHMAQMVRNFGRADTQEPDPEGRVPQWDKASVQEMKDKFSAVGFGPRQLAVMSAFLGPDQTATESLLATDQEVLPWVQKYQRSGETDYEVDLISTLTKLSSLGQQVNY